MISGTAKQRKCYPINSITLKLPKIVTQNILGFHALTGCDSTSSFTGHGKKTCWKVYQKHPELLSGVGRDGSMEKAEEFVSLLYDSPFPSEGVDKARYVMFLKGKKTLEMLPPTKDALELHVIRANYQAKVWLQATTSIMDMGSPFDTNGWIEGENGLSINWSRIPAVPKACIELVVCGCKTKCKLASCKCNRSGQVCTPACGCEAQNCCNPTGL